MQKWVNMVEVNCAASREAEFHDWYNNVHIVDRMKTTGYTGIRRYEAKEIRDGRGKFLAVWGVESDDLDGTLKSRLADRTVEEKAGRSSGARNNLTTPIWRDVFWRQISEQVVSGYKRSGRQRWVNLIELHCSPGREVEFHEWYENIHIPDILKSPGYAGVRRYEIRDARDGRGKYLAIYYIESDDIDETMRIRRANREIEAKLGRSSASRNDLIMSVWRDVLWKEIHEYVNPGKEATGSPFAC